MSSSASHRNLVRQTLRFLCYLAALFLLACSSWVGRTFGAPTIQQVIYHLYFLEGLVLSADNVFLVSFAGECLIAPVFVSGLVFAIDSYIGGMLVPASTLIPGGLVRFGQWLRGSLPVLILIAALVALTSQFSVLSYAQSRFNVNDEFGSAYIDPATVRISPDEPKNLILIYVESLESAYSDPQIFGANLLQELTDLPGVSFGWYRPAPGLGWTMAGIVATQCGIPLQFVTRMSRIGESENENGARAESFLPNATCLPDILHDAGYRNVFLGGASLSFAGKGNFLKEHHYHEAYGSAEWLRDGISPQQLNGWGVYDDDLFRLAKDKVRDLHETRSPFNLTLLTLDTHHPEGHYSKLCRQRGARQFTDVVKCTSWQVVDFIVFLRDNGYLQDTNVAVIGDHLAMPNPVYETLKTVSDRRMFNKFISGASISKNTEEIVPFDLFPSVLEFSGFKIEGDRLGLGYSAFFETEHSHAKRSRPNLHPEMLSYSQAYRRLWVRDGSPN